MLVLTSVQVQMRYLFNRYSPRTIESLRAIERAVDSEIFSIPRRVPRPTTFLRFPDPRTSPTCERAYENKSKENDVGTRTLQHTHTYTGAYSRIHAREYVKNHSLVKSLRRHLSVRRSLLRVRGAVRGSPRHCS